MYTRANMYEAAHKVKYIETLFCYVTFPPHTSEISKQNIIIKHVFVCISAWFTVIVHPFSLPPNLDIVVFPCFYTVEPPYNGYL